MNTQEIFSKVATHLLRQNCKSFQDKNPNVCAYRGDGGLQCAVGTLIPDELYYPRLEGTSVRSIAVAKVLVVAGVLPQKEYNLMDFGTDGHLQNSANIRCSPLAPVYNLLCGLQTMHDSEDVIDWPDKLRALADKYGLTMPEDL